MKKLLCDTTATFFRRLIVLSALMMSVWTIPIWADDPNTESTQTNDQSRIHITADRLVTDANEKNAVFIGNVKAIQETTIITSDRLTVFYREGAVDKTQVQAQTDAVTRILAEGNVKILFDEQTALAEQADYLAEERMVVLTGPGPKIIQGNNSITGSKIIIYMDDGRIHVEGNQGKRVEAVFYSKENGLVSPKKTE